MTRKTPPSNCSTVRYQRIEAQPLAANATRLSCCWLTMLRKALLTTTKTSVVSTAMTTPATPPPTAPAAGRGSREPAADA